MVDPIRNGAIASNIPSVGNVGSNLAIENQQKDKAFVSGDKSSISQNAKSEIEKYQKLVNQVEFDNKAHFQKLDAMKEEIKSESFLSREKMIGAAKNMLANGLSPFEKNFI